MAIRNLLLIKAIVCLLPFASAQATIYSSTSVQSIELAQISDFSVIPSPAVKDQAIDFSITVENIGNIPLNATPIIRIFNSTNSTLSTITFLPVSILVRNNASLIASWNINGLPPGEYSAVIVLSFNNKSISLERTFKIQDAVPQSTGSYSSDGSIGGTNLTFITFPLIKEMLPGETSNAEISVQNSGSKDISLKTDIKGIPREWLRLQTGDFDLTSGDIKRINLLFSIPANAKPGNYRVSVDLKEGKYKSSTFFILRIIPDSGEKPILKREVIIDRRKHLSSVILTVENTKRSISRLEIFEEIPGEIASTIGQIKFDIQPSVVSDADPVVKWVLENIDLNEIRKITYEIPDAPEQYSNYENWFIKQLNIYYHLDLPQVEISKVIVSLISRDRTVQLLVTVSNPEKIPQNVTLNVGLPPGWEIIKPEKSIGQIASFEEKVTRFNISLPEKEIPGVYTVSITMVNDARIVTKDFFVVVKETPANYLMMLWLLPLSILVLLVYSRIRKSR